MFGKSVHYFQDSLGQTYAFSVWPLADSENHPRQEAVAPGKVYAKQTFASIVSAFRDPFHYDLLDLWLEVYQRPWARPRTLHQLIDELADKIARGELKAYLVDSPVWKKHNSGAVGEGGAAGAGGDGGGADAVRSQGAVAKAAPSVAAATAAAASAESGSVAPGAAPASLDESVRVLAARRAQIESDGYQQKYNEDELRAIAEKGEVEDRFLVRMVESSPEEARGNALGFRRDSGRAPYWATTFDQMEAADSDPEIIAALFGMNSYSPDKEYSLVIIDTEKMPPQAERETFSPTYKKMAEFGERELGGEEGFKPGTMTAIMSDKVSQNYAITKKAYSDIGGSPYSPDEFKKFTASTVSDPVEQSNLTARNKAELEFGANPLFAGNGLTKVDQESRYASKIGQEHGVVETFTFERDPLTIGDLEGKGAVRIIAAKPIKG